jgi:uncharacterized delta-60 repeat protein
LRNRLLLLILVVTTALTLTAVPSMANPGDRDPAFGQGATGVTRLDPARSNHDVSHNILVQPSTGRFMLLGEYDGNFGLQDFGWKTTNGLDTVSDHQIETDFWGRHDVAYGGTVLPDGSIVLAGTTDDDVALARYLMPAGQLDKQFGTQGRVIADFGAIDSAYAVLTQPNGLPVIGGGSRGRFLVARYTTSGTLDQSFGSGGIATGDVVGTIRSLAMMPDGSILAAGDDGSNFVVARYGPTGILDPTFGTAGAANVDLGRQETIGGVVLNPDGSVVLGGSTGDDAAAVRLTAAGQRDLTFGLAGATMTDLGSIESIHAIGLESDGSIVVAGDKSGTAMIIRYTANGALDPGFGNAGVILGGYTKLTSVKALASVGGGSWRAAGFSNNGLFAVSQYSPTGDVTQSYGQVRSATNRSIELLRVLPDGSFLGLGDFGGDQTVTKFSPNGAVDSSFGVRGTALTDQVTRVEPSHEITGTHRAMVVQQSGKILVGGELAGDMALARWNADGSVDEGFGVLGSTRTPLKGANGRGSAVLELAIAPDGKLVGAGLAGDQIALARWSADGVPDPTFGSGGTVLGVKGRVRAMVVQSDGKIVVGGHARTGPFLMRFLTNGSIDPVFGTRTIPGTATVGMSLALQPDGKILVGTDIDTSYRFRIDRHLPSGAIDPTFGTGGSTTSDEKFSEGGRTARSMVVDSKGRILVAGGDAVARFMANGSRDVSFGSRGLASFSEFASIFAIGVQGESRLLVAGVGDHIGPAVTRIELGPPGVRRAHVFGYNVLGAVGDGTTVDRTFPVRLGSLDGLHGASAGLFHSMAITADGRVRAWGWNGTGQLGDGSTTDRRSPVNVPGLTDVVQVSAGSFHSMALKSDGTVWAWGWNPLGQLGDGSTADRHVPVKVQGLTDVVQISAGGYHSMAVRRDGTVWSWGWNAYGQLGDGTTVDRHKPIRIEGTSGYVQASAGYLHSLARKEAGQIWAWGWNGTGQLGNYDTRNADQHRPVRTSISPAATDVSAGLLHSLAIIEDGSVIAWGWSDLGAVGPVSQPHTYSLPLQVRGVSDAVSVSAGGLHSVAVKDDGTAWAWGYNGQGQLGVGDTKDRPNPIQITGPAALNEAEAGYLHTLLN